MVKELTDKSFDGEISAAKVLVDFWAPWCNPCKAQTPILEEFEKEYGDTVNVCKLNVDDYPAISKRFGVMSIPSLLFFKDGVLAFKAVGLNTKEQLAELIKK